ncbi:MAG: sigma-54-dependent Fis family transcriptional regulator [Kiritimatiellae bacterium]|nr:sigma-54-dependent Fis family transcriptional regulator [Kiritimatiellia bacterium]
MTDRILIVDDEKDTREFMARALSGKYEVLTAADAELAMKQLDADRSICLLLSDVRMPGEDGITLMKAAKAMNPGLAVILLTAFGSIDQAVAAMKDGADDFITKPVDLDQLELRIEKALKAHRLESEVKHLKAQLDEKYGMNGIVGNSPAMQKVFRMIRQAAPTDATVLIQGPSGTGKELVARAIHNLSNRSKGPFVAVEFAAISPNLLESEMFGHEKGAFTGAVSRRIGRFEAANHGTIFLDEISEMPLELQVKLLRVLQEREFQRVGSNETVKCDIRIVAATNRDLAAYVKEGKFREDLYYRLNVIDMRLPALKERTGDVPLLVNRYLREFGGKSVSPDAMRLLEAYQWPGNVRELRNAVEKMCVLSSSGEIGVNDVPDEMKRDVPMTLSVSGTLGETEKAKILAVLEEVGGNRTKAAERLGISRRTIYRKLEEYGL